MENVSPNSSSTLSLVPNKTQVEIDEAEYEKAEYEEAGGMQTSRIQEFKESTKRTGALGPRGQYTTTLGDVDAIKKQIEEIKKNPAQSVGMGGTSLSADQQKQIKDLESKLAGMSAP